MRRSHLTSIIAILTVALSACAFPQTDEARTTFGGTYYLNGIDHSGVEYGGHLIIEPTEGATYTLQWIITGSVQTGTGTESSGELIVDWEAVEGFDTDSRGTGRYVLQSNGELRGERWVNGQPGAATEEAFPVE